VIGQPLKQIKTNWVFLKEKYFIHIQIFGPKKNEGEFEFRTNEELRRLLKEANIIGIMKSSRIR